MLGYICAHGGCTQQRKSVQKDIPVPAQKNKKKIGFVQGLRVFWSTNINHNNFLTTTLSCHYVLTLLNIDFMNEKRRDEARGRANWLYEIGGKMYANLLTIIIQAWLSLTLACY